MTAKLKLAWATHKSAKFACENFHYSKCLPIGKLVKVGVWENEKFIGVVIFSRGTARYLGKRYGLDQSECVELTRVALAKHDNPVSKILAIALKFLKKSNAGVRLVVSFSAKSEGHHGGIYQAGNWIYAGETNANTEVTYKGKKLTNRAFMAMVVASPYTERQWIENKWVTNIIKLTKYRYLMPLDKEMKKLVEPLARPYPKRACSLNKTPSHHEGNGSANLTLAHQ